MSAHFSNEHLLYTACAGFEAARRLRDLPAEHRAGRLHGHSFMADVRAALPAGSVAFPGAEVSTLSQWLAEAVAPLDYRCLNDLDADASDLRLAQGLLARLPLPALESVGLRSAPDTGVRLNRAGQSMLWRRYVFESAHRLPHVPAGHKCGRMHGHGFEVVLQVRDAGPRGVDHVDAAWAPLHAQLHLHCLNDIAGLDNPTSEMLSSWIWGTLKPVLPPLAAVTVFETASCGAHFDGERYRIWKDFSLDSAVRLTQAPDGDARRRIHGHTFTLRLHLSAPLDTLSGWLMDFGDVKAAFNPIFERLDHQPLYALEGAHDADCASLARWIRTQAAPLLPELDRIDLYERPGCGVQLAWGAQPVGF